MTIIGILKTELNKNISPCGLLDVLIKNGEEHLYNFKKQNLTVEEMKFNFWLLDNPILINQQDYKMFYFVKDERLLEIFNEFITDKLELQEANEFYFVPYSKNTFNRVILNKCIKKAQEALRRNIKDINQVIFYSKLLFFLACQNHDLHLLHNVLCYFGKAFKSLQWTREQIVDWLNYIKKDIPEVNIDFILKRVYWEKKQ